MKLRQSSVCVFCLMAVSGTYPTVARAQTTAFYDIWLSNRLQYERDFTGSDADYRPQMGIYGYGLLDGHLDLRLSGAGDFDLNREDTIDAAYEDSWPRFYDASLDFHDFGPVSHLILGRQDLPDVDYLHFDGLSLSLWESSPVGFFAFGGRPVSYYSSNAGEWLAGAGVRYRPAGSTQLQADAYKIDDRGENVFAYALRMSQYFSSGFGDMIEARWIEEDFRDLSARLYYHGSSKYDISGLIYWQAMSLGTDAHTADTRYFSMYSGFMRPVDKYLFFSFDANRYLGEHYTLSLGGSYKRVLDRAKEGGENFTNIDNSRLSAGFSVVDLPIPNLTFEVFASRYRHPAEGLWDLTGEVGYRFTPRFKASCGATKARYRFSDELFFLDRFGQPIPDETGGIKVSDVVFVEMRCKPAEHWLVALRCERETADDLSGNAYRIDLRVDYRFRISSKKTTGIRRK
ncbi:MAG: hypothetical protein GXP31_14415 [Kiritimatiellaeota bacterium]|nr:hypothetical protein [Kiritimatiellota bacterium]